MRRLTGRRPATRKSSTTPAYAPAPALPNAPWLVLRHRHGNRAGHADAASPRIRARRAVLLSPTIGQPILALVHAQLMRAGRSPARARATSVSRHRIAPKPSSSSSRQPFGSGFCHPAAFLLSRPSGMSIVPASVSGPPSDPPSRSWKSCLLEQQPERCGGLAVPADDQAARGVAIQPMRQHGERGAQSAARRNSPRTQPPLVSRLLRGPRCTGFRPVYRHQPRPSR